MDITKLPKTREQAIQQQQKYYYTGKPCVNGHTSHRYTSSHVCCECSKESSARYNRKHRTELRKKMRKHYQANRTKYNEVSNNWQKRNREHMREYHQEWRTKNKERWNSYEIFSSEYRSKRYQASKDEK